MRSRQLPVREVQYGSAVPFINTAKAGLAASNGAGCKESVEENIVNWLFITATAYMVV